MNVFAYKYKKILLPINLKDRLRSLYISLCKVDYILNREVRSSPQK